MKITIEKLANIPTRYFIVGGILTGLIFAFVCDNAHSAEPQSAVIEFTSAEDLIARVDSVCGVVDTVSSKYWTWEEYAKANYDSVIWNGSVWVAYTYWDTTIQSTLPKGVTSNWWPATIRHRRLVRVTVIPRDWFSEPMGSDWDGLYTAVVWFEWEVR